MYFSMLILATISEINSVSSASTDANNSTLKSGEREGRIFRGQNSTIEESPYVVALELNSTQNCGGSIISPLYIITAAHCFNSSFPLRSYSVRAGSSSRNRSGSLHLVRNFITHEDYDTNDTKGNDIALIRLENPIVLDGKTKKFIKMFSSGESRPVGTEAVVSGWGSLENHGSNSAELQSLRVKILDGCSTYNNKNLMDIQLICASPHKDNIFGSTCYGDSGGPLVVGNKLAGIVHGSHRCLGAPYPIIFTKVAYYRHWIDEKLAKYNIISVPTSMYNGLITELGEIKSDLKVAERSWNDHYRYFMNESLRETQEKLLFEIPIDLNMNETKKLLNTGSNMESNCDRIFQNASTFLKEKLYLKIDRGIKVRLYENYKKLNQSKSDIYKLEDIIKYCLRSNNALSVDFCDKSNIEAQIKTMHIETNKLIEFLPKSKEDRVLRYIQHNEKVISSFIQRKIQSSVDECIKLLQSRDAYHVGSK